MDGSFLVTSSLLASHCPGPHICLHAELCWSVCDVWKLCLLISLSCCCLHQHVQDLLTQSLLTLLSQVKKKKKQHQPVFETQHNEAIVNDISLVSQTTYPHSLPKTVSCYKVQQRLEVLTYIKMTFRGLKGGSLSINK